MKLILILLIAVLILGCGAQHCFTVGGTHEGTGITGEVTYCLNSQKSEEVGRTVFNTKDGGLSLMVTPAEIEAIANQGNTPQDPAGVKALSSTKASQGNPKKPKIWVEIIQSLPKK